MKRREKARVRTYERDRADIRKVKRRERERVDRDIENKGDSEYRAAEFIICMN